MNRTAFILVFLFNSLASHSQVCWTEAVDTNTYQLRFESDHFLQSNYIQSAIPLSLLRNNSFITDENIDRLINKSKKENKHFLSSRQNFELAIQLNNRGRLMINASDRLLSYGSLTQGLFDVVTQGNKQYLGDTAFFSGSYVDLLRFQQVGVGFSYDFSDQFNAQVRLNYLNGERGFQGRLTRAYLSQSAQGDELQMLLHGAAQISDTNQTQLFAQNGSGISIDLSASTFLNIFNIEGYNTFIKVFVDDIGFINWSDNSLEYKPQLTYPFNGVNIENLTNYPSTIFQDQSPDTLVDDIIRTGKNQSFSTLIPTRFGLEMRQSFKPNSTTHFGFSYTNIKRAAPFVFIGHKQFIDEKLYFLSTASFGNMSQFDFGGGLGLQTGDFNVQLASYQLDGLILSKYFSGLGVNLILKYTF